MTQYRNTAEKLAQSLDIDIKETGKDWEGKMLKVYSAEQIVAAI